MSQENVKIVRHIYEVWNAGDMDAVCEALDLSIILRVPPDWPEPGPYVGREAVMRGFEQLRETFDTDWQELISDPVEVGDRVVVPTVWHGVGHGPELKQESTVIFTVRNDQVFQLEFLADHAEALKAVGLEE